MVCLISDGKKRGGRCQCQVLLFVNNGGRTDQGPSLSLSALVKCDYV